MNPQRQTLPLKQAVRQHQTAQRLKSEQLDHLLAMQTAQREPDHSLTIRRQLLALSAVAGITLAFLLGWLVQWQSMTVIEPWANPIIARIADEVVLNHLNLKPMEIETGDIAELRAYFKQLDFHLVETALIASADSGLIGGRYCSIQEGIAVQLRMKSAGSIARMLYQTRYDSRRIGEIPNLDRGERPITTMARGIPVKIWVEHGLLFALTGSKDPVDI